MTDPEGGYRGARASSDRERRRECKHNEGSYTRTSSEFVDRHGCAYVDRRNSFLIACEMQAESEVSALGLAAGAKRDNVQARMFIQCMNERMSTPNWESGDRQNRKVAP